VAPAGSLRIAASVARRVASSIMTEPRRRRLHAGGRVDDVAATIPAAGTDRDRRLAGRDGRTHGQAWFQVGNRRDRLERSPNRPLGVVLR
jgi:hypothetical protein